MTSPLTQIGTEPDPATRLRQLWGEKIKTTRELRDMSRSQLGEAVGVTEAAVGMWERGETAPRPHLQLKVAEVLNTAHSALFPMVAA